MIRMCSADGRSPRDQPMIPSTAATMSFPWGSSGQSWGDCYEAVYVTGSLACWWAGGHYQRGYWGELSNFARAVLGLQAPRPTLEDGVQAHRIIKAILESAESERQVVLP